MESAFFIGVQWLAIAFLLVMLYFALFEPGLPYRVGRPPADPLDSERFRRTLSALAASTMHSGNRVEVLTNGEAFYEAELQAWDWPDPPVNVYIPRRFDPLPVVGTLPPKPDFGLGFVQLDQG